MIAKPEIASDASFNEKTEEFKRIYHEWEDKLQPTLYRFKREEGMQPERKMKLSFYHDHVKIQSVVKNNEGEEFETKESLTSSDFGILKLQCRFCPQNFIRATATNFRDAFFQWNTDFKKYRKHDKSRQYFKIGSHSEIYHPDKTHPNTKLTELYYMVPLDKPDLTFDSSKKDRNLANKPLLKKWEDRFADDWPYLKPKFDDSRIGKKSNLKRKHKTSDKSTVPAKIAKTYSKIESEYVKIAENFSPLSDITDLKKSITSEKPLETDLMLPGLVLIRCKNTGRFNINHCRISIATYVYYQVRNFRWRNEKSKCLYTHLEKNSIEIKKSSNEYFDFFDVFAIENSTKEADGEVIDRWTKFFS